MTSCKRAKQIAGEILRFYRKVPRHIKKIDDMKILRSFRCHFLAIYHEQANKNQLDKFKNQLGII